MPTRRQSQSQPILRGICLGDWFALQPRTPWECFLTIDRNVRNTLDATAPPVVIDTTGTTDIGCRVPNNVVGILRHSLAPRSTAHRLLVQTRATQRSTVGTTHGGSGVSRVVAARSSR